MPFFFHGVGLMLALVGVAVHRRAHCRILGRAARHLIERSAQPRARLIRSLFSAIKRSMETSWPIKSSCLSRMRLIEYPRKGRVDLGFITGISQGEVQELTEDTLINVFVPTTPNPTSGFLLFVPESDIIRLQMPIEDGLKLVISGGMVTPPSPRPNWKRQLLARR
jgi:uncharacterized membrane protein